MGSSDLKLLLIAGLIMKLFVVSAVLAGVALAEPGHNHNHGHRRGHKGGYRTRGYYGKREAKPEADADAYYGGYGYPLTYGLGLGYGGYGLAYGGYGGYGLGYGYGGYGGLGYYGKRDADAEAGHHGHHGKRRG